MKFADYLSIFIIIMCCILIPVLFRTSLSSQVAIENTKYSEYITTACYDAMQSASYDGGKVFYKEEQRKNVMDTFYYSLSNCFNYKSNQTQQLLQYYVPCVAMIDMDGFYINYTESVVSGGETRAIEYTTPINKWTESYSNFSIEYRLDNHIYIINTNTGKGYEGDYDKVCAAIVAEYGSLPTAISFLSDATEFTDTKSNAIVTSTVRQIEYYINMHNKFYNHYNIKYQFELPRVSGEDWARLLSKPTIISFLQGIQTEYGLSYLNVYAMAGAELTKAEMYYTSYGADGTYYYHEDTCSLLGTPVRSATMEKCAQMGAEPCPHCIFSNN